MKQTVWIAGDKIPKHLDTRCPAQVGICIPDENWERYDFPIQGYNLIRMSDTDLAIRGQQQEWAVFRHDNNHLVELTHIKGLNLPTNQVIKIAQENAEYEWEIFRSKTPAEIFSGRHLSNQRKI